MPVTSLNTVAGNPAVASVSTTDYVSNYIYQDGALKMILLPEGYWQGGHYHYYLKDHLGSNRVVLRDDNTILERNHYYPSGMRFGESAVTGGSVQPYRHTGHEMQAMHGLNWIDNGARMRSVNLPIFTTPDPLCEKYYSISPYAYCAGNPIKFIDPDGRVLKYASGYTQAFKQNVVNTIRYMNSKGTSGDIKKIMSSKETVFIKETSKGSSFDANTNTLYWNPEMGIVTTNGYKLSPATVLGHEADHALEWLTKPEQYKLDVKEEVGSYDKKEERRVILGSEQETAKKHGEIQEGETTRYDHSAEKVIKTKSPTTTEIKQIEKEDDKK